MHSRKCGNFFEITNNICNKVSKEGLGLESKPLSLILIRNKSFSRSEMA